MNNERLSALNVGRWLALGLASLVVAASSAISAYASHLPAPTAYVNDFANVLPAAQEAELNAKLKAFEAASGNQIAIAVVKDLGGGEISDFSVRAFEEWKIGAKGKDNGVLIVAAITDRKVRIEVGYGLEGSLTDAQAGDIIRQNITPAFRAGDYNKGLTDGAAAIEHRINADVSNLPAPAAATGTGSRPSSGLGNALPFILFFGVSLLSYVGSFLARSKAIWPGAAIGAVAGGVGASLLHAVAIAIPVAIGFGLLGLFLDYVLSKNYKQRARNGFDTGFWAGGGGFFGGGGGSDDGFGGFGGGSSGGGGASGDW